MEPTDNQQDQGTGQPDTGVPQTPPSTPSGPLTPVGGEDQGGQTPPTEGNDQQSVPTGGESNPPTGGTDGQQTGGDQNPNPSSQM